MIMRWILPCLLLLTACDTSPAAGRGREVWRFAIEETTGSVQDAYAQRFKQLVEERSHGEIDVIVYPYGTLGTSDQMTEQIHNGTIQLAMASPGHMGKLIPEAQAFLLHFVLSESQKVNHLALGDPRLHAMMAELYARKDLKFLSAFAEGWMAWTTKMPVHTPEDFNGMRFRVMTSPLLMAAYQAYGANPVPLPYSQVYSALQLHMIDGQVNPVFAIQEMSFYEVTSHLVFPHHAQFYTTVAANPDFYEGLSDAHRTLLDDVVEQLHDEIFDIQRRFNDERLQEIREAKPSMQIYELDEAQRDAFRRESLPIRDLYLEIAGEGGAQMLEVLEQAVERARRQLGADGSAPQKRTEAH